MSSLTPIIVDNQTIVAASIVTTAETVVGQLVIGTSGPFDIVLDGTVQLTLGASTTGVTLKWRRDSLTGAQVGQPEQANIAQTTASAMFYRCHAVDPVRDCAGAVYVLTAQQTAATGNAVVSAVAVQAIAH